MPPALHPRSSMTLSLFTSTLALSFLVVGLPHIVPCPVPPKARADESDPQRRARRRKTTEDADGNKLERPEVTQDTTAEIRRECPVPKPGGLVGQILGVKKAEGELERPVVRIERFAGARGRIRKGEDEGNS